MNSSTRNGRATDVTGWNHISATTTDLDDGADAATIIDTMDEISLSVPAYNANIGVVVPAEGSSVIVDLRDGAVEIYGDPAGLLDLARWCLAHSDENAPPGSHIHLDPGTIPLEFESASLMLARNSA